MIVRMVRAGGLLFAVFLVLQCGWAQGFDLGVESQLLQSKPDMSVARDFQFSARPAVVDMFLENPMILARLWEAHGFSPRYKVRPQGDGLHVDDPTGIQGDVYPVERAGNRRVWVAFGSLNHAFVPSFKGRMALVVTTEPNGSGVTLHVAVYIRTDNRALGFLASTLFPLVRARVEHRMTANAADFATILAEVSADPQKAAARLSKEDAAAIRHAVTGAKASE
ncbi:MAG TPA: hypothetical protein PK435_15395 [Thermoanaerobaculaceae bacterium]|nr:hypothetical protein [Thermoanaerobaculaceae bacterium]